MLGIVFLLFVCWLVSEARGSVAWRLVAVGLSVQFVLAFAFLKIEWIANALLFANHAVAAIEAATTAGTTFLFGFLGGGETPFAVVDGSHMYLFAFRVLPQVVVFTVLVAILWYWGVLRAIVRAFGWLLHKSLGVTGPVGTAGAASLFLGMIETPLVIRAYLAGLSRTEFFTVMTLGMSTVAGSVMVLYAGLLKDVLPGVIGNILAASVLNIIGAIYVARMLVPERSEALIDARQEPDEEGMAYTSFMDALTRGTGDGLGLAMNVGAMLLVLISLVALLNGLLGFVTITDEALSLQRIMGWAFAPIAWLIGIPWAEAADAGSLLGVKLVLNELVAYIQLAGSADQFSADSRMILVFALCGFANFGSLGILLGGLTTLVPSRRAEALSIAPRSLISGTIVSLLTGAVVALVSLL